VASQARITKILPQHYRYLQQSVYSATGIVLEDGKEYLFESRLVPVAEHLGLASVNELCATLQVSRNAVMTQMVAEAMTTNETYFFREPVHYEAIKKVLLPKIVELRRDSKRMRFWSAASSTGQEAFSLAMMLAEEGLQDWNIEILGTDFCSKVVERARSGVFQQIEVNRGLPASLLVKYFHRSGLSWQLSDTVRRMTRFETLDLRSSMRTLGPFDLVFCRNVMIYFDSDTKWRIIKEIHGTLFRGGWLILGGAETCTCLGDYFEQQKIGNTTVYVAR